MADLLMKLLGLVVRVGLFLAGLMFVASVLAAALLVLLVWLLRALWARLTGQPVSPWTFQMNRQAMWQRFNQRGASQRGGSAQRAPSDVVDVEVVDIDAGKSDITDVEPKRIESPKP